MNLMIFSTAMQTAFITIALPLPTDPREIHSTIETALKAHGTPLRWSITHFTQDPQNPKIAHIEAIITPP